MGHFDWGLCLGGVIVGFVIGLTGMGGGALMTPMLVLVFNIAPGAAVASDVVTSLILKPFGGGVHARRGTVNWQLVAWLVAGSVPMAFLGAYLFDNFVGEAGGDAAKTLLGAVLLVAASVMVFRAVLTARKPAEAADVDAGAGAATAPPIAIKPVPTLLIGAIGGLIVGMTSVGSGSIMIVALMILYPMMPSKSLVGTDLVQAIPLVGAAALGHWIFGEPKLELIVPVVVGAIPAVLIGAHFSSKADDRWIRPILCAVLTVSALKLLEPNSGDFNVLILVLLSLFVIGFVAALVRTYARPSTVPK